MGRYQVYAPVKEDRCHGFAPLRNTAEADLGFSNTSLSPKELFHPQAERMFEYSLAKDDPQAGIVKGAQKDFSPRVVLGVRPCDAKAFDLDDADFNTETIMDSWWVRRRETTTMIGLACDSPCSTCFCTSMGIGPYDTGGLGVLLVGAGEGYAAEVLSKKGKSTLEVTCGWSSVTSAILPLTHKKKAAERLQAPKTPTRSFAVRRSRSSLRCPFRLSWDSRPSASYRALRCA